MTDRHVENSGSTIPVLIAIGANLGNPEKKVREAIRKLCDLSRNTPKHSSLWQTAPVHCPEGSPSYINAAVSITVNAGTLPESFLERLLELEASLGRTRSGVVNEARVIDLDLICFGSIIRHKKNLTLPHPRAHQRSFVLAPLAEIEPDFIFPELDKTVKQLLESLPCPSESHLF